MASSNSLDSLPGGKALAAADSSSSDVSGFFLSVTGQVDSATLTSGDNMFVKYSYSFGPDWKYMHGLESGISQIAKRATGDGQQTFQFNFPLDVVFRSTNCFGWPQIVLSVYSITARGTDTVRGYGAVHIPTTPGRHVRKVALFAPRSSSLCQRIVAWMTGNPPELFDSKFIAQGKGREVTRVRSTGVVTVVFNVATRNMNALNYVVDGEVGAKPPPPMPTVSAGGSGGRPGSPRTPRAPRTPRTASLRASSRAEARD